MPLGVALTGLLYVATCETVPSYASPPPPPPLPPGCAEEAAVRPGNEPQHPAQCHGNPNFERDARTLLTRGDIASLPTQLKNALGRLACRPHSTLPIQFFSEADRPSELFQYYLLTSRGFQPNVFTALLRGVNDTAMFTATGANCQLPPIAAVRLVVEPKEGLPDNPDDPRAFIDIITDISGLFVINNESGWYEGWMIHDLRVADVSEPDVNGHAKFGTITPRDAAILATKGTGNNIPGHFFTVDGNKPRFPQIDDEFPTDVSNLVPLFLSMGAYNSLQQSDAHQYWEFNYQTNWIHPLYELPFTGGFPDASPDEPADTYEDGELGRESSIVPGVTTDLVKNRQRAIEFGDNPNLPRDPDKFDAEDDSQREFRERFIPSALAREVFLNAFERLDSFRKDVTNLEQRLRLGYIAAIACVDIDHDGIISAEEGDIDSPGTACGFDDNTRLYLLPKSYDRFAVTREINDGYLAPRFSWSQRAWVLSGPRFGVSPAAPASADRDSDDR